MLNTIKKTHASDFTWKNGKVICHCNVHEGTRVKSGSWSSHIAISNLLHHWLKHYGFPCLFCEGIDEVQKAMVKEKEDNEKNETSNTAKLI